MTGYFRALMDKAAGRSAVRIKNGPLYGAAAYLNADTGAAAVGGASHAIADRVDMATPTGGRRPAPVATAIEPAGQTAVGATLPPSLAEGANADVAAVDGARLRTLPDAGIEGEPAGAASSRAAANTSVEPEYVRQTYAERGPHGPLSQAATASGEDAPHLGPVWTNRDGPQPERTGERPHAASASSVPPRADSAATSVGRRANSAVARQAEPASDASTTPFGGATNARLSPVQPAEPEATQVQTHVRAGGVVALHDGDRRKVAAQPTGAAEPPLANETPQQARDRTRALRRGPEPTGSIASQAAFAVRRQASAARPADAAPAPVIEVNIGRVEVRPPAVRPSQAARPKPQLGLGDYLRRRGRDAP